MPGNTKPPPASPATCDATPPTSRVGLAWEIAVFQFKLALDGLRDLLLVPVSLVAGIIGVILGGDRPDRFFQDVLRFGRASERWINLFGGHGSGTSDELIAPLQARVMRELDTNTQLRHAGEKLEKNLDRVADRIQRQANIVINSKQHSAAKKDEPPLE